MPPNSVDRQTFLENLRRSELLNARELQAAVQGLPETDRGRDVARALIKKGVLTRFQAQQLLAGRTRGFVIGQYRILEQIGKGGMGRVYKAMHRTMKRVVALKVLAPELVRTEKARRLFKREVRAAAQLLHPNIVTAYDANKVTGRYFLVMEYVDGPNLDQLVRQGGPLPVSLACELVRQAAAGLQHALSLGMIHRDIKPGNLMVARGGPGLPSPAPQIKILDFGLARLQEAEDAELAGDGTIQTSANTVLGTPDYLSPEQCRDLHATDIRSDLYSLGCTFYYLLTGQVPFPGGTSLEKLVRHASEDAEPVESLRPSVPAAVAAIVRKLMAKDPAERYQAPDELAAALAPFCKVGRASRKALKQAAEGGRPPGARSEEDSSPVVEVGAGPEEVAASASTWPPDLTPTPASQDGPTAVKRTPRATPGRRHRARAWLWAAAAVALGLGGAVGLFLALQ
jgi:serine/threonine protein kinase